MTPAPDADDLANPHWRRNLWVCVFGSFTTGVAMTLLLPFLPPYLEHLGVLGQAAIAQWSGLVFGATFFTAALTAPLWGWMADRWGRKPMLIRASLGMAVTMALMGLAATPWQLLGLRLLTGLLGGYASGSVVLVATQTPRERSGWALGTLSMGFTGGSLLGPLVGGALPPVIGIRNTFFLAAGAIFVAFLATCLLIREQRPARVRAAAGMRPQSAWRRIPQRGAVAAVLATGTLFTFAHMSIEPIVTLYMAELLPAGGAATWWAGLAMAAGALGNVAAAPWLGRLADRVGHRRVIVAGFIGAAALLVPQALVGAAWQLVALRLAMGAALAAMLPCIATLLRHGVPREVTGTVLGWSTSAQYAGQVAGPLMGGWLAGHAGMRSVFWVTSALMLTGAALAWRAGPLPATGD